MLAPGRSFVFDRALDCSLPLVGAYAVHVGVSFGAGEWSRPREIRAFTLSVTALPNESPREIEGIAGLWASMGSSAAMHGSGGHGRTLLGFVNATSAPLSLPRMRLLLRVRRVGSSFHCEDKPILLDLPDVLPAGEAHYEPIEVSCLGLTVPGEYEIAAQLLLPDSGGGEREVSLGRLRVDVVTDPALLNVPIWR